MILIIDPYLKTMNGEMYTGVRTAQECLDSVEQVILEQVCRWNHGLTLPEVITTLCGVMGRVVA